MSNHHLITQFDEARAAGMTAEQAARWVAYVEKKRAAGEEPIELWEAVAQIERAEDEAHIDKVMRRMFNDAIVSLRDEIAEESA